MSSARERFSLAIAAKGAGALAVVVCLGCNSEPLTPLEQFITQSPAPNGVKVDFCTDPATPAQTVLKYLIILDHSGSNSMNYIMNPNGDGQPFPPFEILNSLATDPLGVSRYGSPATPGTLLNFLANAPVNSPKRGYALIDFNSNISTYPQNETFTSDINTGDANDFYQEVLQDAGQNPGGAGNPTDGGDTDYIDALGTAYTIISNDIQQAQICAGQSPVTPPSVQCPQPGKVVSSTYVIIFMSDGSPIISINGLGLGANIPGGIALVNTGGPVDVNLQPEDQILAEVASIIGLQSNAFFVDAINMFTVYYYVQTNIDNVARQYLTDMAKVGNGIMYDITGGSLVNYGQFSPPSKLIKYTLSDVFVTNSSVQWWSDGKIHPDTDMDGLPDDIEQALGSDPFNADSDGNGIPDGVEYWLNGTPCASKNALGQCKHAGATNYLASGPCTGMATIAPPALSPLARPVPPGSIAFNDTDFDGLNDCAELLLNNAGGWNNPDSNGDGVEDWLEFKNNVPFQLGSTNSADSVGVDGSSAYQKIKTMLPANMPSYQMLDPEPSQYTLNLISTSDVQDCYELEVSNLPQIGNGNTVRVDVFEKSPLVQGKFMYRTGQKQFAPGSQALLFNDWNNAAEQAAGTWKEWP